MNTQTKILRGLIIFAASLLLATIAHAAPKIDPKLIGKWNCVAHPDWVEDAQYDFNFSSNGIETVSFTSSKHKRIWKATFTARIGLLTIANYYAIDNGLPIKERSIYRYKYKVMGNTLILSTVNNAHPLMFHRLTP
jgi:hypothetical protein